MNYWAHMNSCTWFILSVGPPVDDMHMSPDNEIPAVDQLYHEHNVSCLSPHFSTLRPCSRMLAYGLCSTARPPETLTGWYQRPRQSSLPWGFFTTTVYTPTLRYHQWCLSLSLFIIVIVVGSSQRVLSHPYTVQYNRLCQTSRCRLRLCVL